MSAIDVCKIQEAQLTTARDKFFEAVKDIIANLGEISRDITEISQDTQDLSRANSEEEHSFFEEMAGHLAEVSSGLHQYDSASHDLALVMSSVAAAIGDMSICLRDIEAIEIAIERIALNACIKAAHLGGEGAALGVLAGGIQRLVGDTRQQTLAVAQKLESIIATSQGLAANNSSDNKDCGLELSFLNNDIDTMLQSLRGLHENSHASLNQVKEKGQLLSQDLQRVGAEINVHERAADVINHVLSSLQQIQNQLQSHSVLPGIEASGDAEIEILQSNYTMKAERLVHVSVASSPVTPPPQSSISTDITDSDTVIKKEESNEEDLGDNVELF